ncbi:MAG TPA: hypothetical protein VI589_15940 [Vicinamibacteria bacterium]
MKEVAMYGRLGRATVAGLVIGLTLGSGVPGTAGDVDDDLAVVKKAVQADPAEEASPAPPARTAPVARKASRGSGQWLKVRIVEGHGKRSRITVNLPLSVARALGGDLPIEVGDQRIRLSDVLSQLEAGEPLVEVKKRDSIVRVWIE